MYCAPGFSYSVHVFPVNTTGNSFHLSQCFHCIICGSTSGESWLLGLLPVLVFIVLNTRQYLLTVYCTELLSSNRGE